MEDRLAFSVLDWWEEAGVDTFVEDAPRDWLAAAAPAAATMAPAPMPPAPMATAPMEVPAAAPGRLPDDLATFRRFMLTDPSVPGPPAGRIDADGDPASGVMLVIDMPEAGDRTAGRLLSGDVGALWDRMLTAMGLSRETTYLAPLSPARPGAGRLDADQIATFGRLMRHHVGLASPRRLLLLGEAASRALLDLGCVEARGRTHHFAGGGGTIPAIATFHPRLLVQTPARKSAAWADLKLFMAL